jgi:hypothetical protein
VYPITVELKLDIKQKAHMRRKQTYQSAKKWCGMQARDL